MTARIPELDGIRALAILPVMCVHTSARLTGGFLGVDLFFVLSGFLITSLLLEEHRRTGAIHLGRFFARRALRILPPMVVCIALAAAFWSRGDFASAWPAALFFYANLIDEKLLGSLSHTWTLSIEEQFYALWPALLCLIGIATRRVVPLLVGVIVAAFALRTLLYLLGVDHEVIYRFTGTRIDAIAAGCVAAFLMGKRASDWAAALYFIALLACLAFAVWDHPLMMTAGYTAFAVLCALFIRSVAASANSVSRFLASAPMGYIGSRSYGLYLYHLPIYFAVGQLSEGYDSPLLTVLKFGLTFVVAEISYRTVEAWALSFKTRFTPVTGLGRSAEAH